MARDVIKANGIHYTPPELAAFLAGATAARLPPETETLTVLDPSCGDGALLQSLLRALPESIAKDTKLYGCETDPAAIAAAQERLANAGSSLAVVHGDFLSLAVDGPRERTGILPLHFDVVIANPPYVRTQILGARRSQDLARRFGLRGRVDLAHAFAVAMTQALRPGGTLALLTSNRFLTTRGGADLRRYLDSELQLHAIYDLGDTRLFRAAVLPAIIVATRGERQTRATRAATFTRVYEDDSLPESAPERHHILEALDEPDVCAVRTPEGTYRIHRGRLVVQPQADGVWSLETTESAAWCARVRANQTCTIGDVATVRVGIKTTADAVFVRDDWDELPAELQPEPELLKPLVTHHVARRWRTEELPRRRVLYPYELSRARRTPVDLTQFPRAQNYLLAHEDVLRRRQYVLDAGRDWFEIWVPHSPTDWAQPRIVFRDISDKPVFFFDESGAIVQGDCYWMTLKEGQDPNWLPLILAVCNSTFMTRFYDIAFHNKLYGGRRRFMTQYVKQVPLPSPERAGELLQTVQQLVNGSASADAAEQHVDDLVRDVFGLSTLRAESHAHGPGTSPAEEQDDR